MKPDDKIVVVPYVIGNAKLPPKTEEAWLGIWNIGQQDASEARRRTRGKTAVRRLNLFPEEEEDQEREERWKKIEVVLQEEAARLLEDEPEVADALFDGLKKIKNAVPVEEEYVHPRHEPDVVLQPSPRTSSSIEYGSLVHRSSQAWHFNKL